MMIPDRLYSEVVFPSDVPANVSKRYGLKACHQTMPNIEAIETVMMISMATLVVMSG